MGKLIAFNSVSLDGFFVDQKGDMSWAHNNSAEFDAFVESNAKGGGVLLFGRKTYDLMVSFWPTPLAAQSFPVVAERMNRGAKVVFSKSMRKPSWNNTRLVSEDIDGEVRRMKGESGVDMVILGSGSIVSQLTQKGMIDEYQIVVIPVVLGGGRTMFDGVKEKLMLKLVNTRSFDNGNVFLCYQALKK
jgi:dihydrofolate reductase